MMRRPVNPYRTAGALIGLGAIFGLAATIPISRYLPALVGVVAFGIVLLMGFLVLRKRSPSRGPATACVWFALLGGHASFWSIPLVGPSASFDVWSTLGALGVFGMGISLIGAGTGRLPEDDFSSGRLVDRDRFAAILMCAGGALGFMGAPLAFFGPFMLLKLFCFSLILVFGVLLFQKRRESRMLASAGVYFALLAGGVDLVFFNYPIWILSLAAYWWPFFTAPLAVALVVIGAVLRIVRTPTQDKRQPMPPPGFAGRGA